MAKQILRAFVRIEFDENQTPTSMKVARYGVQDDSKPGVRVSYGMDAAMNVADLPAALRDKILAACRAHAGI